jgi:hypothetical protein
MQPHAPTILLASALPALLLLPLAARGELVEADLVPDSGDRLLTQDTRTGLEWLDLQATDGWSIAQALASPYATDDGFRVATAPEVDGLLESAGVDPAAFDPLVPTPQSVAWNSVVPDPAFVYVRTSFNTLEDLLGTTDFFSFQGATSSEVSGLFLRSTALPDIGLSENRAGGFKGASSYTLTFDVAWNGVDEAGSDERYGVFLVRDTPLAPAPMPIPIPWGAQGLLLVVLLTVARRLRARGDPGPPPPVS